MARRFGVGGWFKTDLRLYVGSRDCSKLAENMRWQVEAVQAALESAGFAGMLATPVLCFVDGEWPLISPSESYQGVRLEGKRSIKKLVTSSTGLSGNPTLAPRTTAKELPTPTLVVAQSALVPARFSV